MNFSIDFKGINELLFSAYDSGRNFLYEYEVYSLLKHSGAETPPQCTFIPRGDRPSDEVLNAIPGDKAVLKIVSPTIIHKTEVGGVKIVEKESNKIRSTVRRMLYEVPENYAAWIERSEKNRESSPPEYKDLTGEALIAAISRDLKGVLQVQFMPPDSSSFGNELIVGVRRTREFGTILSAGLGGTDTELYAQRFRKGQAIVAGSTEMNDGHSFFQMFKKTISYLKLAGLTRGQRRIVTDEQLIECFDSFISLANYYSPTNPHAPFILEELEINPFAFIDYLMVPLDGMCRFSLQSNNTNSRPIYKIDNLLHPESIGIIGVSSTRRNFGRIILDNILTEGFDPDKVVVVGSSGELTFEVNSEIVKVDSDKLGSQTKVIHKIKSVPDIKSLTDKLDLFIVAVAAKQVPDIIDDIIYLDAAQSVMLISGGMGETDDSKERARQVVEKIYLSHKIETVFDTKLNTEKRDENNREKRESPSGGPVFLGANCMGVISRPGGYDTWFIPEEKLPKERISNLKDRTSYFHRAALISQSGAFMLHRTHQFPQLRPAYMISMGNQTDLTLGDMVHYFKNSDNVDVIAIYAEGFNDLDGLELCKAIHHAVLSGKEVIFYKAGRTPEGKAATSGHTASLAGDYMVCENCVRQAGAIVARNFTEFQELFSLAENLNKKIIKGNRLAAVSSAGFEAVGMADSIQSDDFTMELARFEDKTKIRIKEILDNKKLNAFVTIANPLDINPAADDEAHAQITAALAEDANVDAIVLSIAPLSPSIKTLDNRQFPIYDMNAEDSILHRVINLVAQTEKPIIAVVDGGVLYEPLRSSLMDNGISVFTVCDRAIAAISLYIQGRLAADAIRGGHGI
ncbi:MAG: acetate--CoA ligase family protein [Desulfamplus sp.]|nr:acetate--CoA ligase family protein [Desulfamplus sp.]